MRHLIALIFIFISFFAHAQTPALIVEGTSPNLYIDHVVLPKESLYSVSRLYNLTPAALASFNKMTLQSGLKIGETVKIPLNNENFVQQNASPQGETLVPLYHVVENNETLFRISNNYNKLPLQLLKSWNALAGDNIAAGTPLIVGYLKVKNEQLAALRAAVPAVQTQADNKPAAPAQTTAKGADAVAGVSSKMDEPAARPQQPVAKSGGEFNPTASNTNERPAPVMEEKKPEVTKPGPSATRPANDLLAPVSNTTGEEGYFANNFKDDAEDRNLMEVKGEAATFKSTSGWQDKKYYALINNVPAGTIIKVTDGNRSVYAKVLGELPDIKENNGVLLRLSNAAASYLQKIDPKFGVTVTYYQ